MRTLFQQTKRTEFLVTNGSTTVPKRLSAGVITDVARAAAGSQKVVITTQSAHGLYPGCTINFIDTLDEFTGQLDVYEILTSTTFVVMVDGDTLSSGALTIAYYADIWFRHAVLLGLKAFRTANVGNVYIGASSTNSEQPYIVEPYGGGGVGEVYLKSGEIGASPVYENLADYYIDVLNADDGVFIRYI